MYLLVLLTGTDISDAMIRMGNELRGKGKRGKGREKRDLDKEGKDGWGARDEEELETGKRRKGWKRRKRRWKREIRKKEEKTYKSIPTWYSSTFPSSILSSYRQMALWEYSELRKRSKEIGMELELSVKEWIKWCFERWKANNETESTDLLYIPIKARALWR
jgi:hypothetical protein